MPNTDLTKQLAPLIFPRQTFSFCEYIWIHVWTQSIQVSFESSKAFCICFENPIIYNCCWMFCFISIALSLMDLPWKEEQPSKFSKCFCSFSWRLQVVKAIEKVIPIPRAQTVAENDLAREELKAMEAQKVDIDRVATLQVRRELWGGLAALALQTAGFMRLTFWELSWDVMEPICFFVTSTYFMAGYAFFLRTKREPSFEGFFQSRFAVKQKRLMQARDFDFRRYSELRRACGLPALQPRSPCEFSQESHCHCHWSVLSNFLCPFYVDASCTVLKCGCKAYSFKVRFSSKLEIGAFLLLHLTRGREGIMLYISAVNNLLSKKWFGTQQFLSNYTGIPIFRMHVGMYVSH